MPKVYPDQLLTPLQVAKILGKDKSTIIRWCWKGQLKAWQIGKQWVIDRQSVDEYRRKKLA